MSKLDFARLSSVTSEHMGRPWAFIASCLMVVVWAVSGPLFKFSDTWQLIINTPTTVLTFLAVFLLQSSQNEDTRDIQLKLDAIMDRFNLEKKEDVAEDDDDDSSGRH